MIINKVQYTTVYEQIYELTCKRVGRYVAVAAVTLAAKEADGRRSLAVGRVVAGDIFLTRLCLLAPLTHSRRKVPVAQHHLTRLLAEWENIGNDKCTRIQKHTLTWMC